LVPSFHPEGGLWNLSSCVVLLELGWGNAPERGVEPLAVEPGDVLDDGELELCSGAPDAVADQLGLEQPSPYGTDSSNTAVLPGTGSSGFLNRVHKFDSCRGHSPRRRWNGIPA
jgi:hypothetical protein